LELSGFNYVAQILVDLMAGYLYNYQTKEFYNLSYAQEVPEGPARFGGLLIYPFFWLSTPY